MRDVYQHPGVMRGQHWLSTGEMGQTCYMPASQLWILFSVQTITLGTANEQHARNKWAYIFKQMYLWGMFMGGEG